MFLVTVCVVTANNTGETDTTCRKDEQNVNLTLVSLKF